MSQRTMYPSIDYGSYVTGAFLPVSGILICSNSGTLFGNPMGTTISQQITGSFNNSTSNGIDKLDSVAWQFIWTGTPSGTFTIEQSMDFDPQIWPRFTGTWASIGVSPQAQPAGSAGSSWVGINNVVSPWLRWRFTPASSAVAGTGTLTAYSCGKGII